MSTEAAKGSNDEGGSGDPIAGGADGAGVRERTTRAAELLGTSAPVAEGIALTAAGLVLWAGARFARPLLRGRPARR